ncbi:hypothetical protein [Kitasatospora sp. NBC_01300]|uniref:hypothetical protein n=1 Tax=Kitasatospora sp. NBC_01300 TaxID=2903574 RepID=UPI00352CEB85|nr:hypothetical protein OG556_27120 [Kitasatospora sp. NBC_01300]
MVERMRCLDRTEVAFVLPAAARPGRSAWSATSTAGSPAPTPPAERAEGDRVVVVILLVGRRDGFRQLAQGEHWLDEAGTGGHDGRNGFPGT